MATYSALQQLSAILSVIQTIPNVRVSSAQARGAARGYAYYGAVRYEIRLAKDGHVMHVPCERATSDRRSPRLAERDAKAIAEQENRIALNLRIGALTENDATRVLAVL